ncbi:hypothetical protein M5C99_20650 [Acidovorax sp. NCPPB 2350]|nr:hypothetical protein M5C99_20650 [Acidovorax sp. NCPPB 2350]
MSNAAAAGFCLLGLGTVFDAICNDPWGHGLPEDWTSRRASSVAALSGVSSQLLEGLDPARMKIFVAVDHNALNYARLELYGAARLRGLRMPPLIHARAVVAPDARIGDNCWVGGAAVIGQGAHLQGDVMVHPAARVDAGAQVGMHGWIGPGASVGAEAEVGSHCVIGSDTRLQAGVRIGRHCVLDRQRPCETDIPAGSFAAPQFANGARIVGAGYSFEKPRR